MSRVCTFIGLTVWICSVWIAMTAACSLVGWPAVLVLAGLLASGVMWVSSVIEQVGADRGTGT